MLRTHQLPESAREAIATALELQADDLESAIANPPNDPALMATQKAIAESHRKLARLFLDLEHVAFSVVVSPRHRGQV